MSGFPKTEPQGRLSYRAVGVCGGERVQTVCRATIWEDADLADRDAGLDHNAFRRTSVLALVTGLILVSLMACAHSTPPFVDESGVPLVGSIAQEMYLTMPGAEEYVLIRGRDRKKPAVLFLHGGPGGSETALMRAVHPELEAAVVMVYWDQRGAGKSYRSTTPIDTMTITQFIEDMDHVVEYVRRHLGRERLFLLGHSWGATLGMLYAKQFPEKVAGYIGVGQPSGPEVEHHAYEFVVREAQSRGEERALAQLKEIGPPPYGEHDKAHVRDHWLHRFGGYTYAPIGLGSLVWRALWTPEAGVGDLFRAWSALHFSQTTLAKELARFDLTKAVPSIEVPVTFILGRHDERTWAPLAERYLEQLDAPGKRLLWLEHSAHNGPFEEPALFRQYVLETIRNSGGETGVHAGCTGGADSNIERVECVQGAGVNNGLKSLGALTWAQPYD